MGLFNFYCGLRVVGRRQTALDSVGFAGHVETHRLGIGGASVPVLPCELNAAHHRARIEGATWDGGDLTRHRIKHVLQERPCHRPVGCVGPSGDRGRAGPIGADKEAGLAVRGLKLRQCRYDANGVALERLTFRPATLDVRPAGEAMTLQTPVQRRAGQPSLLRSLR